MAVLTDIKKRLEDLYAKLNKTQTFSQNTMAFSLLKEKLQLLKKFQIVEAGECHYLPHLPVVKETKDTTNIHIVFDASATSEVPRPNECLYKAPQWTPLVFDTFLRF